MPAHSCEMLKGSHVLRCLSAADAAGGQQRLCGGPFRWPAGQWWWSQRLAVAHVAGQAANNHLPACQRAGHPPLHIGSGCWPTLHVASAAARCAWRSPAASCRNQRMQSMHPQARTKAAQSPPRLPAGCAGCQCHHARRRQRRQPGGALHRAAYPGAQRPVRCAGAPAQQATCGGVRCSCSGGGRHSRRSGRGPGSGPGGAGPGGAARGGQLFSGGASALPRLATAGAPNRARQGEQQHTGARAGFVTNRKQLRCGVGAGGTRGGGWETGGV